MLNEATYRQVLDLKPNVAVLPWGATEAHNYHLPHGTDNIEATRLGEDAVGRANARGARCVLLPTVPFGNDNMQLDQAATITMRSGTQQAVLSDVAYSLVRQGIDRLVVLNFHGGNEFKSMIRDVMLEQPIFIVQVHGYLTAPQIWAMMDEKLNDHASEFETSLMLHLQPEWVAPLDIAGDGAVTPSKLPSLAPGSPGVWAPRDWKALTRDTGSGNPKAGTAEKGARMWEPLVEATATLLAELSSARNGDFPYVVRIANPGSSR